LLILEKSVLILINRKFIWIVIVLVVLIGFYYFITLGFESRLNSNYGTDN